MYPFLLPLHSAMRWLVLTFLVCSLYRAIIGMKRQRPFTATDNALRHWTATVAHLQLVIGMVLYTQSPVVRYFWRNASQAMHQRDYPFYALVHLLLMMAGIAVLTIGSALAKRKTTDQDKFKTMLAWYSLALLIILASIPWPFSPLATRPYFRTF